MGIAALTDLSLWTSSISLKPTRLETKIFEVPDFPDFPFFVTLFFLGREYTITGVRTPPAVAVRFDASEYCCQYQAARGAFSANRGRWTLTQSSGDARAREHFARLSKAEWCALRDALCALAQDTYPPQFFLRRPSS